MTSEERREARYLRRKLKREDKRKKVLEEHGDYYKVINRNALSRAARSATKNVSYKESVKRFMMRRLTNTAELNKKLMYHKDVRKGFICFSLMERGKLRDIMSVHFSERVVQKSLNQNALVPVLTRSLIYDNGASQKAKGTSFARKRLVAHLRRHYRIHGREGYILLIDFKDYFGNIDHERAKQIIRENFEDDGIIWLSELFIDAYHDYKRKKLHLSESEAGKGLGLGSEINQTIAITYPSKMDHYIKEVLKIKGYGRYMDDSYLIHESKEYLQICLDKIKAICRELRITINEKKTRIVKMTHGFTFLKTQYFISETGKIVRKPCHNSIVRERRKLKKQCRLLQDGKISFAAIRMSYASWRGSLKHGNARRTVHAMDRLFDSLLIDNWRQGGEMVYG